MAQSSQGAWYFFESAMSGLFVFIYKQKIQFLPEIELNINHLASGAGIRTLGFLNKILLQWPLDQGSCIPNIFSM